MKASIDEHRKLTAERTKEMEAANKVKNSFEIKLKLLRELAAQP
jgi:hypothetical protein